MIKIKNLRSLMLLISVIVLGSNCSLANSTEELAVTYQQPIILELSAACTNRISFEKERIVQIIGDTNYFTSFVSEDGKSLFLTTKVGASKLAAKGEEFHQGKSEQSNDKTTQEQQYINVSVITASREVLDFSFKIVDSAEPKLIKLTAKDLAFGNNTLGSQLKLKQIIKDLIHDNGSKYYVLPIDRKGKKQPWLTLNGGEILAFPQKAYRYGELIGYELIAANKSRKWQMLDLLSLKKAIPNLVAVKLAKDGLLSKETSQMWLVIHDQGLRQ